MRPQSRPYMWRDDAEGRVVSWRIWVLIWLLPVVFGLAAALLAAHTTYILRTSVETQAEVVRVYRWDDTTGVAPLMRFTDETGAVRQATPGARHRDWDFEIGSTRTIRYFPGKDGDILLPGPHNWFETTFIGLLAVLLLLPALYLHRRLRRWLTKGTTP